MNPLLPTAVILTMRLHNRLGAFEDKVRTLSIDAEQLEEFDQWVMSSCSFNTLQEPLLRSIRALKTDLDNGEYDESLYRALANEISSFKAGCWKQVDMLMGKLESVVDDEGDVRQDYTEAFWASYPEVSGDTERFEKELLDAILEAAEEGPQGAH